VLWLRATQILYYDGQFDDARLDVTLATSAAAAGAVTSNYTECVRLIKVCAFNYTECVRVVKVCAFNYTESVRLIKVCAFNYTKCVRIIKVCAFNYTECVHIIKVCAFNYTECVTTDWLCACVDLCPGLFSLCKFLFRLHICRVGQNHIYAVYIRYLWQGNY
jgi:hypothetical protein